MGKHMCGISVSVFFMISAFALTLISIYFDYWYEIDASGNSNSTIKNEYSYRYDLFFSPGSAPEYDTGVVNVIISECF
jgi:hypothetical protein